MDIVMGGAVVKKNVVIEGKGRFFRKKGLKFNMSILIFATWIPKIIICRYTTKSFRFHPRSYMEEVMGNKRCNYVIKKLEYFNMSCYRGQAKLFQRLLTEAVVRRCSLKRCSKIFRKINRKTPVLDSFF